MGKQPPPRDALIPDGEVVETVEAIEKKKKSKDEKPMASVGETLSFIFACGPKIKAIFILGCISGIGNGLVYPALAWLFSTSFSSISGAAQDLSEIREIAYMFLGFGGFAILAGTLQNASFEIVAYNASRSFRLQWFQALLRQDTAFFDVYDISGIAATIGPNSNKYKRGVGSKFGEFIQFGTTTVGGLVYAFYASWQVALVVLAVLPAVGLSGLAAVQINQTKSTSAAAAYAKAGSVAYSTVSAIKTVLSLNAIPTMIALYAEATLEAFKQAKKLLWKAGLANGGMLGSFILLYCILTLFGTYLIWRDVEDTGCDPSASTISNNDACPLNGADVFGAMLGVAFAGQGFSQLGNFFGIFTAARVACYEALQAINRKVGSPAKEIYVDEKSADEDTTERSDSDIESGVKEKKLRAILPEYDIDSFSRDGLKPPNPRGAISFRNVSFHYPTRPSEYILNGFNLKIKAGKTVALVGASGGGKSTTVAMIERFYDPQGGSVLLDGINIKDINVHYLRSLIGYVGQEPTLFATTIAGNIKYGRPNATQDEVEAAARMANAHDFIMSFPDGYSTQCGDKGTQLSGGQKQRIAIARVLIANPRILLLDEATSALDSESELVVQEALENVMAIKKTTIVIAHRLSTIRQADSIAVVFGGRVVEQGTHEELIAKPSGHYRKLVDAQDRRPSTRNSIRGMDSRGGSLVSSRNNSYADLKELQEIEMEVAESVDALMTPHFEFKDVCFAYPTRPKKPILDDFHLSVRRGETVGLVGPSGGGKSTVISMIERFYDPDSGSVEFNGVDIKGLNLKWYRDQIGYVGQEPVLFDGSIAQNIAYGAPGATREEIEEAAKQANAYDFITSFPEGFETPVGERGTQLSGGQKQRVAIARALVKKPTVILLDEATSALDSESEAVVQEALDRLMESRDHTTIVIAHRLSTLSGADRIAFIADGVVKEYGSHNELLHMKNGRYKRLFEAQTRRASVANNVFGSSPNSTVGDEEEEEPDYETEIEEAEKNAFDANRARQMAKPDSLYMLIGAIGAILAGGVFPAWGIMFGETIFLLFTVVPNCACDPETNTCTIVSAFGNSTLEEGVSCVDWQQMEADSMREESFVLGGYWVAIAAACVIGNILTFYGFGMASERLNKRVRDSAFTALVRQEVAFYDKRSVGSITSQLEEDAARIHTFSGEPIRSLLTALSSLLIGLVVSFVFMWPFALLACCCIPVMGIATSLEMKKMMGEDEAAGNGQDELNSPGGIAVETLLNIRTVAALTLERERFINYRDALAREQPHYVRDAFLAGFSSGVSVGIQQWVNALQFWFGGWIMFTYQGVFSFNDFLISMFSLLFSLFGLGAAFQGISDKKETEASAGRIFYLLDRKSEIDPMDEGGKKLD